jgi:predicted permease
MTASMWQDIRYGLRGMLRTPAFTATVVLVLALGIGANTALFSVVDAIFFRPPAVTAPHDLVYLYWLTGTVNRRPSVMPRADYDFFVGHNEAFAALTAHIGLASRLTDDEGMTQPVWGEAVYANYFDVLGVKPALGRVLRFEEDRPSTAGSAIVLSHALWQARFRSDPAVIGKEVRLASAAGPDRTFTVVGVMAPGFKGLSDPWRPSQYWVTFAQGIEPDRATYALAPVGRLAPGVTLAQARTIVATQAAQLRSALPNRKNVSYLVFPALKVRMPFEPDASLVPARIAGALTVAVFLVLLIAGINAAGMLLARGVRRTAEIAVRRVVGASRWRIARQLVTESLLFASLGGALGVVIAGWLLELFRAYTPNRFAVDVAADGRSVMFATATCLVSGLLIGAVPAWRGSTTDVLESLPGSGLTVPGRSRRQMRFLVVVPQIGLALVLLLVAGMQARALLTLERVSPGYRTDHAIVATFGLRQIPGEREANPRDRAERHAERSRRFYRQLLARLDDLRSASDVGVTNALPVRAGEGQSYTAVAQEDVLAGVPGGIGASRAMVSPGYFRAMGMSVLEGRDFDERDETSMPRVAVISQSLARQLWAGRSAVGRLIAARNNFPSSGEQIEWREVVGVVNEVGPILRDAGPTPFIYESLGQQWLVGANTIVVRAPGGPQQIVERVKAAVEGSDALAQIYSVQTMADAVAAILYPRRLAAATLGASAAIGLLLASVGLYGLVSYSVEQRFREIGIRAALGADRADILRLVVGEGLSAAMMGAVAGLLAAALAIRLASRLVVGVPKMDAATLILMPALVIGVVVLACYLPARRAVRIDPADTLRRL